MTLNKKSKRKRRIEEIYSGYGKWTREGEVAQGPKQKQSPWLKKMVSLKHQR